MTTSKRALDITAAIIGLILCAPVMALIALIVRWDSSGPILYRGTRIGKDGKTFQILKFRTMYADAARRGGGITTRGDPRITRVGKLLRRTKLDELPQLVNVLRGDMSLVGPRPEDPRYLQYYSPSQRIVLNVRPGITSAASIVFRDEEALLHGADWERTYIDQVLPHKLDLEVAYLARRTFWSDLTIIGKTFLVLFQLER